MSAKVSGRADHVWQEYVTHRSLVAALADRLIQQLSDAINERGQAAIALSGGSTPKPLFKELALRSLDWQRVIITLVDERWVPETHILSNGALLKRHLINVLPVRPVFVPLYIESDTIDNALPQVLQNCREKLGLSLADEVVFDATVLGMGGDGHTASFFPDANNIDELLDPNQSAELLVCESVSSQVPRVTWSLSTLLKSQFLALHISGKEKRNVFEQACAADNSSGSPISAVIDQEKVKLNVYYTD